MVLFGDAQFSFKLADALLVSVSGRPMPGWSLSSALYWATQRRDGFPKVQFVAELGDAVLLLHDFLAT